MTKRGRILASGLSWGLKFGVGLVLLFSISFCGNNSGQVTGQNSGSDNLTITGRFINNTSSTTQAGESETPSCVDTDVLCSVDVVALSGEPVLSQQVTVSNIPYCQDLPKPGTTFSMGNFSLDPTDSRVQNGFQIECACQRSSGGSLEGFFNKFSGGGTAILGPDGKLEYICSLENLFLDFTKGDGQQALLAAGCGSIVAFQFLLNSFCAPSGPPTDPPTDPGFFCGSVFALVNKSFDDFCEITFCEQVQEAECQKMADCPAGTFCFNGCCHEGAPEDFCVGCQGNCSLSADTGGFQFCYDFDACDPETTIGVDCGTAGQGVCDALSSLPEGFPPTACDGTCCSL